MPLIAVPRKSFARFCDLRISSIFPDLAEFFLMVWKKLCKSNWKCAWNLAFPVFISPIVWNMCENRYISKRYTATKNTIDRIAGAAVVSIITSDTNSICLSSQLVFHRWRKGHKSWQINGYCWFSHDAIKIQTNKLSILPRFYFHDALEELKTNFYANFRFKKVLGFVIEYAWIFKLLFDAPFTWRPRELSPRLKKWLILGNFAI